MPLLKKPIQSALLDYDVNESPAIAEGHKLLARKGYAVDRFKAKNFLDSLSYAYEGLLYATQTQRNFRIHLVMTVLAVSLATVLHISVFEWALLLGLIGLVLFAELTNTAIELFVDMLTEGRYDERAKSIKDVAAGAVLVTAASALIAGVCIFTPHLYTVIQPFLS